MPIYYHINRGKNNLNKKFIDNKPLFFSKHKSFWYNFEKEISKDLNGYIEYKIFIPKSLFTYSFNPRTKNKIVKITKHNIHEYQCLKEKYRGHNNFIKEMNKRNIIGIDATIKLDYKKYKLETEHPEGYIWKKLPEITITKI